MRLLRNRYLTILKNDTFFNFLRDFPFILLYDIKIWLFVIFFSRGVIPEFIKSLKAFSGAISLRKKIQNSKKVGPDSIRKYITGQI